MQALREYVKVENHTINIRLPDGFDYEEVEVIIMPKNRHDDLSALQPAVELGIKSPISNKPHQTVFSELKARYAD